MKKFRIEFENISNRKYIPVIQRVVIVTCSDEKGARNVFNKEFKNQTGKRFKINKVEEIKED